MSTVTISKSDIKKRGTLVVMPLVEYERLKVAAVPKYQLTGKAARDLDKLVEDGLKEYQERKTIAAPSLKEALKIYKKRHAR